MLTFYEHYVLFCRKEKIRIDKRLFEKRILRNFLCHSLLSFRICLLFCTNQFFDITPLCTTPLGLDNWWFLVGHKVTKTWWPKSRHKHQGESLQTPVWPKGKRCDNESSLFSTRTCCLQIMKRLVWSFKEALWGLLGDLLCLNSSIPKCQITFGNWSMRFFRPTFQGKK